MSEKRPSDGVTPVRWTAPSGANSSALPYLRETKGEASENCAESIAKYLRGGVPNVCVGAGAALLSVRGVDCDVEEDELRRGLALRAVGRAALDAHRPAVVGWRPRELGAQRDAVAGVGDLLRRVRPAVVRRVRVVAELALLARVAQPAAAAAVRAARRPHQPGRQRVGRRARAQPEVLARPPRAPLQRRVVRRVEVVELGGADGDRPGGRRRRGRRRRRARRWW